MKKLVVAITGGTLLLLGVAMIALPGPAIVVIPAALAILATEFLWARQALQKCKSALGGAQNQSRWLHWLKRRLRSKRQEQPAWVAAKLRLRATPGEIQPR